MTTTPGFGPLARIDGPPRLKPKYGLLQAADKPNSGVRIVPDADGEGYERWGLGSQLYPYPPGLGDIFVDCGEGSDAGVKEPPDDVADQPIFGAVTAWFAERCKAVSVPNQPAFQARAFSSFDAVESAVLEKEILTGSRMPNNSHLADGTGTFPNGDVETDPLNGLAILQQAIAEAGSGGIIHVSPQLATFLTSNYVVFDNGDGVLRTGLGTTVIPGFGYVDGATPRESEELGAHADAVSWQEWAFATGPIDIRRSEIELLPGELSQALDRGPGGATRGVPNTITYIVERHYLIDWDGAIHASVLIDRCTDNCGDAPS